MVVESDIVRGLHALGLNSSSTAIVHSSLRSFGYVEGGARTVCQALIATGATLLFPAGSGDMTGVPAPPGLVRPHNAALVVENWQEFDELLNKAVPFTKELPIDKELGVIPETIRQEFSHIRSPHPLMSYLALGSHAVDLIAAQRLDWPLRPLEVLTELEGDVLLLGVTHTSNTMIHHAEQLIGRSQFYRYAKAADHVWMELPNIPGESHNFDEIEPEIRPFTQDVMLGRCRARLIPARDVIAVTQRLIQSNPAALLCDQLDCRCYAALQQRLESLSTDNR